MYSTIKDIVIAVIFWTTIATTGKISIGFVYDTVKSATQSRVSVGLSPVSKFTDKLTK